MGFTGWIIFLVVISGLQAQDMHFMGGSMTYKFIDTSSPDQYKIQLTTLTAWVLGLGPCGENCSVSDIGRTTTQKWNKILDLKGDTYFGNWTEERGYPSQLVFLKINSNVSEGLNSEVTAVDMNMRWEQETVQLILNIDPKPKYTDFRLHGIYWRPFDYARLHYPTSYSVQVHIISKTRNDTGQPNNSPVAIFRPVYRILLNTKTTIKLSTMDIDGDIVQCEYARFVEAGGLEPLQKTTVSKDCTITIDVNEADGFTDGGWGAIPVKILERNEYPIQLLGEPKPLPKFYYLGAINVQFMIQTLRTIDAPEFVDPTRESQHEFNVYAGSLVKIELYARPTGTSKADVSSWHLTSIPRIILNISPLKSDVTRTSERVKYGVVTWRPISTNVGTYLISAVARDTNGALWSSWRRGSDGNDRNYKIVVKDIVFTETVNPPEMSPYFSLFPNISGIVCMKDSTCSFPLYTKTKENGVNITSVKFMASTFKEVHISTPYLVKKNGQDMYVADVTITASLVGEQQRICFQAWDSNGGKSSMKCLSVTVPLQDPCREQPCRAATCEPHGESYTCRCFHGLTGRHCEIGIDYCASNPCVQGSTCFSYPKFTGRYLCVCSPGNTDTNCNKVIIG